MLVELLLVLTALLFGLQALRAKRLLVAALWLAGVSLLVSTLLYRLGAAETAVIELSVGAGLVTVLFVFAIAIAGEDAMTGRSIVPGLLGWLLFIAVAALLGWLTLPIQPTDLEIVEAPFAVVLWQERGLDVLVQIGLIFAGVLGILGLLSEPASERVGEFVGEHMEVVLPAPARKPADSQTVEKEPA
jgi:uncharacterized MnhB-related membrane protein